MNTNPWIDVAAVGDVPEGDVIGISAAGRAIALYGVEGEVYATDDTCTHGQARLCDGFLDGHEIECPLHQGKFDVRTGRATCAPAEQDVRTYPVRIEAGRVYLDLG